MHSSSLENLQKCCEQFLPGSGLLDQGVVEVMDIGGANVNGSYADIFSDAMFNYVSVDMQAGEGVDVVLDDPYQLPFADNSFDIVVCGQVFEHAEFFWELFKEMVRVTQPRGLIFLIVPSAGPIHRYPVDCYRFYPDSMQALSRYVGINLLDCWLDDRGPWNDLVGVFSHSDHLVNKSPESAINLLPLNRFSRQYQRSVDEKYSVNTEYDAVKGEADYLEVIKVLHQALQPQLYLEIGIDKGQSLALAQCMAVGVDPDYQLQGEWGENVELISKTSREFFEQDAANLFADKSLDLVFINGIRLFEVALIDFIYIEKYSNPNTVVMIKDIFPNHIVQAMRERQSRVWTGDIWKVMHCLQNHRADLELIPIDAKPAGMLLIRGLNSSNLVLKKGYNPLIRYLKELDEQTHLIPYIERRSAISPEDAILILMSDDP